MLRSHTVKTKWIQEVFLPEIVELTVIDPREARTQITNRLEQVGTQNLATENHVQVYLQGIRIFIK